MTPERIAELRVLCETATKGPWEADIDDGVAWTGKFYVGDEGDTWCTYGGGEADGPKMTPKQDAINAAFVAASRSALPELLDEVERLQLEVEAVDEAVKNALDKRDEAIRTLNGEGPSEWSRIQFFKDMWRKGVHDESYQKVRALHAEDGVMAWRECVVRVRMLLVEGKVDEAIKLIDEYFQNRHM